MGTVWREVPPLLAGDVMKGQKVIPDGAPALYQT